MVFQGNARICRILGFLGAKLLNDDIFTLFYVKYLLVVDIFVFLVNQSG